MKLLRSIVVVFCTCAFGYSQDIPDGVRYKKAPDEINGLARTSLEKAITSTRGIPANFFGDVIVVGPSLWKAIKPGSEQVLLDSKPMIIVIPGTSPLTVEGKVIRTDRERKAFWSRYQGAYPMLKDAKIRSGKAEEISYYWATIPFDIEEPFWVVEAGSDRFITNFQVQSGQPRLFWIDLVRDLATLKP